MHTPTHAQATAGRAAAATSRLKRSADLCRRDPALWSRIVQRQDWYEAQGWERVAAALQAELDYGLAPVDEAPQATGS